MKSPHADLAGARPSPAFKQMPKRRYVAPAYLTPLPGELTMKQFCLEVAEVLGISSLGVYHRHARGRLNGITVRRVNAMVVFVRPFVPLPEYLELIRALNAQHPGCSLVAGGDVLGRRDNELTTGEWIHREADRLRTTPAAVSMLIYRHKVPRPKQRFVGKLGFISAAVRIRRVPARLALVSDSNN